jgi:peptidyl-prolyl cis-trans isomerase A (cyclophilin A)
MKPYLEMLIVMASLPILASCTPREEPPAKKEEAPAAEKPKATESTAPPAVKETPPAPKEPEMKPAEKKDEKPAAAPTPPTPPPTASESTARHPALMNPSQASEKAPDTYKAKLATTKGDIIIEVTRDWAPNGADRFYNLVRIGYFTDIALFRVIEGFMAQFGIHGDPAVNDVWREARIQDDPVKESNRRGYITFATAGPNTRTTQLFINFADNSNLDRMGFAPFGKVSQGMDIVDSIFKGYGEGAPRGQGPRQDLIQSQGNAYLRQSFPNLDYVKSAEIVP